MRELLLGMERPGLIARETGRRQGRRTPARLTDEGAIRLEGAAEAVRALERRLVGGLSSDERRRLLAYLVKCADALGSSASRNS